MGMYAKLMSRITESSLMDEDISVRYTFLMLLAIADPYGYVVGTDIAIARRLNMPLTEFQIAIAALMLPDPNSNSMEEEGRRVILSDCERGYFLVNYRKYRDTRDEEHRREYMREYMRKRRATKDVADVNSCKQGKPKLAKAEAESEAESDGDGVVKQESEKGDELALESCGKSKLTKKQKYDMAFDEFWELYPKKVGKIHARKAWDKLTIEKFDEVLDAIEAQCEWDQFKGDPRYIPHPATWLNEGRWDDIQPSKPGNGQMGTTGNLFV